VWKPSGNCRTNCPEIKTKPAHCCGTRASRYKGTQLCAAFVVYPKLYSATMRRVESLEFNSTRVSGLHHLKPPRGVVKYRTKRTLDIGRRAGQQ
jgi:hypothetical protein